MSLLGIPCRGVECNNIPQVGWPTMSVCICTKLFLLDRMFRCGFKQWPSFYLVYSFIMPVCTTQHAASLATTLFFSAGQVHWGRLLLAILWHDVRRSGLGDLYVGPAFGYIAQRLSPFPGSDLMGRSTAFNATLFFTSLFGLLASLSWSYTSLCVLLFLLGTAVGVGRVHYTGLLFTDAYSGFNAH